MIRAAAGVAAAIGAVLVAVVVVEGVPGRGRPSAAWPGDARGAPADQRAPGNGVDSGRLPEDPEAGRKSELQWRAHLDFEERERQQIFDRQRIKQHRAVIKLLGAARTRYDRARTPAAVARVREAMPATIEEARRQINAIDHWGNNSPLLKDYDALIAALSGAYPEARLAALGGDGATLAQLRGEIDGRVRKMKQWLEEAARSEDE